MKEKELIKKICEKENFDKMLLDMRKCNESKKINEILMMIENNKAIKETFKKAFYEEVFDYMNEINNCCKEGIKKIFINGIESTIKEIYRNGTEIKTEENLDINNIKKVINEESGIIRKVDKLGRIVIPIEFRENVIEGETPIKIYNIEDYVVVEVLDRKSDNYIKKFDNLGRIVVKVEIRKKLKWKKDNEIKIWKYGNKFILHKIKKKCVFCGNENNLIEYKEELLCEKCKEKIKSI